jgi:AbiV family abortive infection protein
LEPNQAIEGVLLSLANVEHKLLSAESLARADPATAAFLATTAFEELAKAFILHTDAVHGSVSDWKAFWDGIRNHDSKKLRAYLDMPGDPEFDKEIRTPGKRQSLLAREKFVREACLYVDRWEEESTTTWTAAN